MSHTRAVPPQVVGLFLIIFVVVRFFEVTVLAEPVLVVAVAHRLLGALKTRFNIERVIS